MKLYYARTSPSARAVILCLEALGLKPEYKVVQVAQGENLTPEYLKMNPQHTVPTLDDNGFYIWDSHAINAYLVSKYGKTDSLYPRDLQKRAIIHQRLHFDSGVLFPRLVETILPVLFDGQKISEENRNNVMGDYDLLEKFLENRNYIADNNYTIADFSCVTTVSTFVEVLGITTDARHSRVSEWLQRCKNTLPGYSEAQDRGLNFLRKAASSVLDEQD